MFIIACMLENVFAVVRSRYVSVEKLFVPALIFPC